MRILTILYFLLCGTLLHAQNIQPESNAAAAADYDAKLNVGDKAIAVATGRGQKMVKIFDKKDGMYQCGPLDITAWEIKNRPNSLTWYKANSVYPYYDIADFNNRAGKYKQTVQHFLLCFAQEYKIRLDVVTGQQNWPTYFLKDEAEKAEVKKKMDELNTILQSFGTLPNTYLPYTDNPRIWQLVAEKRDAYIECLAKVKDPEKGRIVDYLVKEIEKSKTAAQQFTGGTEGLYNSGSFEWMKRAVSAKARADFFATQTGWNTEADRVAQMNKALDELKAVCADKIHLLKMSPDLFKYRDAAAETVMRNALKNPAALKVHKIGLSDADWIIAKNDYGIPLYRYKRGQMWVRNSSDDHPYCKGLFFEVRQDYSGGGTYGASKVNNFMEELYGCPQ